MESENRPKTGRKAPKTAFKPGRSGNPGGRPKRTTEEFELLRACEAKAPEALDTILDLMTNAKQDTVKLAAATYIIERRYGKPTEHKEVRTGALDDLPREDLKRLRDELAASLAADPAGVDGRTEARTTH